METLYPPSVDQCNTTIGELPFKPHFVTCWGMGTDTQPYAEIGLRLEKIRTALSDMNQKDWAKKHNFNVTQYNNWEKGVRRIPVDSAEILCERYTLTLDAIYRGKVLGLPDTLSKVF